MEDIAFKKMLVPAYPTETCIFTLCAPDDENHDTTLRLQAAAHWLSLHCRITVSFHIYKQVTAETHGCIPAWGKTWARTIPQLPGIHQTQRRVQRLEGGRAMLQLFLTWISGESGLHQPLKSSTASFVHNPLTLRDTNYVFI